MFKHNFVREAGYLPLTLNFLVRHTFLLFLTILVFTTCISLSPVSLIREQPVTFTTIENVQPQWQTFADGINYFHGKTISPRLEFYALQIDLSAPNLEIVTRAGRANSDNVQSTKVSSFVRDNNLVAGINATPFNITSSKEGLPLINTGVVISGSKLLAPINPRYDALVFYTNGAAAIVNQSSIGAAENIKNAVGGFYQVLVDGDAAERTLNLGSRHPRSAAGVSANGEYLYLLVIDGRRAGSAGATERETAYLLRSLGSWNGINFDGGGSSALALRYPDGKIRTVNTPIHNRIPGIERAVAGCIGIYITN